MDPGYEMTIDELRQWNKNLINEVRTEKIYGGFVDVYGVRWDSSPVAIANLNAVCTLIGVGVVTTDQTWRDANNVDRVKTPAQMIQLAGELAVFGRTCYSVSWFHKENIETLSTIEELLAYDIMTGWPS